MLVTLGVLACTAKRGVYGWRPGSRQCTGEDAYTPSLSAPVNRTTKHRYTSIALC
jgi:hypothetical protein